MHKTAIQKQKSAKVISKTITKRETILMAINKKEIMRAVKYTLFAASAGVIQLVSAFLLELVIFKRVIPDNATIHFIFDLDKSSFIAESIALALSVIWNFTFNRKFTFKAATNVPLSMALAFLFYVPFYPFQIWYINTVRGALLSSIGEDLAFVVAQVTCILINFVLEFTWQRFVVFRNKLDTNGQANDTATDTIAVDDTADASENIV